MAGPGTGHPVGSRGQRGTITLWVLGLCVSVLFLGGLSLDLWRILTVHRDLAAAADAAAAAGANGLDEESLRTGGATLDPERVAALVLDLLSGLPLAGAAEVSVDVPDGDRVVVTLESDVPLTLLDLFGGGDPVTVRVSSEAEPRRLP